MEGMLFTRNRQNTRHFGKFLAGNPILRGRRYSSSLVTPDSVSRSETCRSVLFEIEGAFFWDYSGIGILGIDGVCVLLGDIPFSE